MTPRERLDAFEAAEVPIPFDLRPDPFGDKPRFLAYGHDRRDLVELEYQAREQWLELCFTLREIVRLRGG